MNRSNADLRLESSGRFGLASSLQIRFSVLTMSPYLTLICISAPEFLL